MGCGGGEGEVDGVEVEVEENRRRRKGMEREKQTRSHVLARSGVLILSCKVTSASPHLHHSFPFSHPQHHHHSLYHQTTLSPTILPRTTTNTSANTNTMAPPSPSPSSSSSAHKPSETKWRLSSFVAATGLSTEQAQSIATDMEPFFYASLRGYDGKSFSSKTNKALIDNALTTAFASLPILQQVEQSKRPAAEACLRKLATYLKERGKFVYPKSVRSNGTAASRCRS